MNTERTSPLLGVHHVTAICGDPQRNVDFYGGVLGLRLVKKTVNFDDPTSYHLYYGDDVGHPGTILTFFAWIGHAPLAAARGRRGTGQITAAAFSIPERSMGYWVDRFAARAVDFEAPAGRFDEEVLVFQDPDGLQLELVAHAGAGEGTPREDGSVPAEHAVRRIFGATLSLEGYERTAALLTETLGFGADGSEGERFRFTVGADAGASRVDLLCHPEADPGRIGIGTVHHIAWRTADDASQRTWHHALTAAGYDVTPVLDRKYFQSIYFREPGGVLFEIATDPPGFTVDESVEALGTGLRLPEWLEPRRERIESRLPELRRATKPAASP